MTLKIVLRGAVVSAAIWAYPGWAGAHPVNNSCHSDCQGSPPATLKHKHTSTTPENPPCSSYTVCPTSELGSKSRWAGAKNSQTPRSGTEIASGR